MNPKLNNYELNDKTNQKPKDKDQKQYTDFIPFKSIKSQYFCSQFK